MSAVVDTGTRDGPCDFSEVFGSIVFTWVGSQIYGLDKRSAVVARTSYIAVMDYGNTWKNNGVCQDELYKGCDD